VSRRPALQYVVSSCRLLAIAGLPLFIGGSGLPRVGGTNCICTSNGINHFCYHDLVVDRCHDAAFSPATTLCTVMFSTAGTLLWFGFAGLSMWSESSWGLQIVVGAASHADHVNSARAFEYVCRLKPRPSLMGRSRSEIV
jgi:hypothetical protein